MYPELFRIGNWPVHSFGVMFMLSFLVPILVMRREFSRVDIDPELASNIGIAAILGGIAGARIYFIFEHLSHFRADPWGMIFSGAGLVWYGGVAGGFLAAMFVVLRSRQSFLKLADIVVPLLLLGHAIGRVGCFLAADGDYGPPSDAPWAMAFPNGVVPTYETVHPTPLYDIIFALAFFAMIWPQRKKNLPQGTLMSFALIGMGVGRFITEFYRNTPRVAFGWMTLAQIISLLLIAIGSGYLMLRARKRTPA